MALSSIRVSGYITYEYICTIYIWASMDSGHSGHSGHSGVIRSSSEVLENRGAGTGRGRSGQLCNPCTWAAPVHSGALRSGSSREIWGRHEIAVHALMSCRSIGQWTLVGLRMYLLAHLAVLCMGSHMAGYLTSHDASAERCRARPIWTMQASLRWRDERTVPTNIHPFIAVWRWPDGGASDDRDKTCQLSSGDRDRCAQKR